MTFITIYNQNDNTANENYPELRDNLLFQGRFRLWFKWSFFSSQSQNFLTLLCEGYFLAFSLLLDFAKKSTQNADKALIELSASFYIQFRIRMLNLCLFRIQLFFSFLNTFRFL